METKNNTNKLSEPEMTYGYHRHEPLFIYSAEYERLKKIAEESHAKDFTDSPSPYTREELEARILVAQAEIDAGIPGLTSEEVFNSIEKDNPWLSKYL